MKRISFPLVTSLLSVMISITSSIVLTLKMEELDAKISRAVSNVSYVAPPKTYEEIYCYKKWQQLPINIKRAWRPLEFEQKCVANAYVAACKNGTVDFDDDERSICQGTEVDVWLQIPD